MQSYQGRWSMEAQQRRKEEKQKKTNEFTLARVGTQGEPESICAAFWDAIWIVWLLALLCLLHLQCIQVTVRQLGMKTLEGRGIGDREGCYHWKTRQCVHVCFTVSSWEGPFRLKCSLLQVFQCPLEDRSASSDWAVSSQLVKRLMASIKACWKQKKAPNKVYIRIWASGEQWACGDNVKDNQNRRKERLCLCVSEHASKRD